MPVEKRGDAWGVRLQVSGQKIRQSLGVGSTKKDALDLEAKIRRDAVNGKLGRGPEKSIDEAMERWLDGEASGHKDIAGDEARVRAWRIHTDGHSLRNAVVVAANAIDRWRSQGLGVATINRRIALLRRVCRLAHAQWGWLDQDISRKFVALPGERDRKIFLTREQVMSLAHHADRNLGDAILLSAYTGLRKGELLRLTKADVEDGCVIVRSGKTKTSERVVPVPRQALPILKRLPIKYTSANVLDKDWQKCRKAAGLEHVRFHDLRHTYGSWLAQSGATSTIIRDVMGHSSLTVTSRYLHSAPDHVKAAVRKLK